MSDGLAGMMYQNALIDLTAGRISDLDRQVLAYSPLPSSIVDPYMAKEVDAVESMNVAFSAMTLWIEEAKKASYFSKHFLELSRMIMNGVTTMGRGLVTLHLRGEDLGQSPMSVHDLIMVASYHIRKSYLGMLQTVKRWPEISGRLLVNQLGWTNTLLRLYKTKEKLEQKTKIINGVSQSDLKIGNEKSDPKLEMKNEELEMSGSTTGGALAAPEGRGLDPVSAFSEPKSLGAVRAFRPVGSTQKAVVSRQYAVGSEVSGKGDSVREEETKAETQIETVVSNEKTADSSQKAVSSKISGEGKPNSEEETKDKTINEKVNGTKKTAAEDETNTEKMISADGKPKSEKERTAETEVLEANETKKDSSGKGDQEKQTPEPPEIPKNGPADLMEDPAEPDNSLESGEPGNGADEPPEVPAELDDSLNSEEQENRAARLPEYLADLNNSVDSGRAENGADEPPKVPAELDDSLNSEEQENRAARPPEYLADLNNSVDSWRAENGAIEPPEVPAELDNSLELGEAGNGPPGTGLPGYLQILRKVYERSGPSDDGALTFTIDEMEYLISDPIFTRIYPDMAEALCGALRQFPVNTPSQ